jgi:hypothetical protein
MKARLLKVIDESSNTSLRTKLLVLKRARDRTDTPQPPRKKVGIEKNIVSGEEYE